MNNDKYYKITALLLFIGLLTGCSAKIKSTKSAEFNQKVTRVLFMLENKSSDKAPGSFFGALTDAFTTELKGHTIESMGVSESELAEEIRKYNPDVVMSIVQTRIMKGFSPNGGGEYVGGATFEINMFTPANPGNRVWTANVKVKGNLTAAEKSAAKKMAANLVEKLGEDGIIDVVQSK